MCVSVSRHNPWDFILWPWEALSWCCVYPVWYCTFSIFKVYNASFEAYYKYNNNSEFWSKGTTHICTLQHKCLISSLQLKLGAFCALKWVVSRGDAGGGALEIHQWQICDSGSEQVRMMKLSFIFTGSVFPPAHTYISLHTWSRGEQSPPWSYRQAAASGDWKESRFFLLFVPSSCPMNSNSSWV